MLGVVLLGLTVALSWLSGRFVYGEGHLDRPIPLLVALLLASFAVYAAAVARVLRHPGTTRLSTVLFVALLLRAVWAPSNFIQEDDIYRYVWDGQVSLEGISPYRYAPAAVETFELAPEAFTGSRAEELAALSRLADEAGAVSRQVLDRVNYPAIPTIYPPGAQAVFAAVQRVIPWSPIGMRGALLLFDGLCILLLVLILTRCSLDPSRVLIYAWSPLVLKEFANSGHMDTIPMAAVLLCLLLLLHRRWLWAACSLALGVAGKYYPLVLLPVVGAWLWRAGWRAAAGGLAVFLATLAFAIAPRLEVGLVMFEGLSVYAGTWQQNAGLFGVLEWAVSGVAGRWAPIVARGLAGVILAATVAASLRWRRGAGSPIMPANSRPASPPRNPTPVSEQRRRAGSPIVPANCSPASPSREPTAVSEQRRGAGSLIVPAHSSPASPPREPTAVSEQRRGACDLPTWTGRWLIALGALFLLSPVQNPWYLAWIVPLLCLHPSRAWLLLTGLMSLYYLGFLVEYRYPEPQASRLLGVVMAAEYVPFYGLLVWEMVQRIRGDGPAWLRARPERETVPLTAGGSR